MSAQSLRVRVAGCLVLGSALLGGPVRAADPVVRPGVGEEPRVPAGKCLTAGGLLLASERPGRDWEAVGEKESVHSRDLLLALPGTRASLEPRPDSVKLTLWGNLPGQSAFPGRESSVVLHDSRAFDLDLTLVSGRVVLANRKVRGPARVWVRLPGAAWALTLAEPGTEVALELHGVWPPGVPFTTRPVPADRPLQILVLLVLKGQADLKTRRQTHSLSAPPGPAYFSWDSVAGEHPGPQRRDQGPPWADPKAVPAAERKALAEVAGKYQELLKDHGPAEALRRLLAGAGRGGDKDRARLTREFAVLGLAAVDEVERTAEALADPDHAAVRDAAVGALRHWIAGAAGRDLQLYQMLIDRLDYSRAQAETALQLLHNQFSADEPDTYPTLIAYLRRGKPGIRELAWWHLSRMVPGARKVAYDPAAPEDRRQKACDELARIIRDLERSSREK